MCLAVRCAGHPSENCRSSSDLVRFCQTCDRLSRIPAGRVSDRKSAREDAAVNASRASAVSSDISIRNCCPNVDRSRPVRLRKVWSSMRGPEPASVALLTTSPTQPDARLPALSRCGEMLLWSRRYSIFGSQAAAAQISGPAPSSSSSPGPFCSISVASSRCLSRASAALLSSF